MTASSDIGITPVPTNTTNPSVPCNDGFNLLAAIVAATVSVEFATDANKTLLPAEWQASVILLTDSPTTLTTGRDVIFPAHFGCVFVKNNTAQTLTLKKSGQTGVALAAGGDGLFVSGATDVVRASGGSGSVTSVNGMSGAVVGVTAGKHAIPMMAGAIAPSVSGGCSAVTSIASAANQPDIVTLDFDSSTQEYAQFAIPMPKSWNEGTITARFRWSHAATTTNFGVVWNIQAVAVSDDDTIAVAFGTAQQIADTGGTTNDLYVTSETPAITVGGSPAAGDTVFFRVSRVTGDGSDTMAIDARLHSVDIFITTDADTDA